MLTPFVVVDAAVDVTGPPPGSSTITVTSLLLLESVSELLQQESVLVNLCLELTELLQVQASEFLGGGVHVPCCSRLDKQRCGIAGPLAEQGAVACPFTLITCPWNPEPDVEALSSGIVSAFIIGVGVAEAVVAHGQEKAHSLRVTKPGEVCSGPCPVLLRGVSVGVSRGCGEEVKGEMLVES